MEINSCAFTGHRPKSFPWKYNENAPGCVLLKEALTAQITALADRGVTDWLSGMALGVDMWSGEILLKLKEQSEYSDIEIVIVLPHPNHDIRWDRRSKERMAFLLKYCTGQITIGTDASAESYYKRNRYLTDHADCLVAVYDNERAVRSGTGMTVRYAEKQGKPVFFIHPNTGVISQY